MGQLTVLRHPVLVVLEYDDVPIGTIDDGWGPYDIFTVISVSWQEVAGKTWEVVVQHPSTGLPIQQTIGPGESGSENLPVPARFPTAPFEAHCSLRRV